MDFTTIAESASLISIAFAAGMSSLGKARRHASIAVLALGLLAQPALAITGTWAGELSGSDGGRITVTYAFSPRGALVVQLPSREGYRAIELTHAGQTDSWLAPNGRAASGRVQAIDAGPTHFDAQVTMDSGGELFPGVLRQERVHLTLRFRQEGARLAAYAHTRTEVTVTGGPYRPKPPEVMVSVHQGMLERAP